MRCPASDIVVDGGQKQDQCPTPLWAESWSGLLEVRGCGLALSSALEIEADLLPLVELTQARLFDGGDVDEHVRTAAIRLDEAEAFCGVEPFDRADGHEDCLR